MVQMTAEYLGGLECRATHGPSGAEMRTDAPEDLGGKGSTFSPTDLVATGLLTCIMTTMAMVAERAGIKLDGMTGAVEKIMRHLYREKRELGTGNLEHWKKFPVPNVPVPKVPVSSRPLGQAYWFVF